MTYTRTWDNTLPLGSSLDASDIDGEFRRLKVDIEERFATITSPNVATSEAPVLLALNGITTVHPILGNLSLFGYNGINGGLQLTNGNIPLLLPQLNTSLIAHIDNNNAFYIDYAGRLIFHSASQRWELTKTSI